MPARRLDEVTIFNEKLRFFIPHEWVEEYDDSGTYTYQTPETDSGWFRVSLITTTTTEPPEQRLPTLFDFTENVTRDEPTGNLIQATEEESMDEGSPLHIFYWKVGNAVPPNLIRVAVFSYTILADRLNDTEVKEEVELLRRLVSKAEFSWSIQ